MVRERRSRPGLLRAFGRAVVDGSAVTTTANFLLSPLLRYLGPAILNDLALLANGGVATDPRALAQQLGWLTGEDSNLLREFETLWSTIEHRTQLAGIHYPRTFGASKLTALLLYVACRAERPVTVLETGVADGVSSLVILRALDANGSGVLHSVDVRSDVGSLVAQTERARWQLHTLRGMRQTALRMIFSEVPRGQIFLHDSNHSYSWQRAEFRAAKKWLQPGGLLLSDDVEASAAFGEWCKCSAISPQLLFTGSRILGIARL